eukprot:9780171-Karenia_brevis.AAC.1
MPRTCVKEQTCDASDVDEDFDWQNVLGESTGRASDAHTKDPRVDPDEFKRMPKRPYRWNRAVEAASKVHISSMRVMLEAHYDACHLERYSAMRKESDRQFRFDRKV